MTKEIVSLEYREIFPMIEPSLPEGFNVYVENKLSKNRQGGRPHLVKQLKNMENILELLSKAWIDMKDLESLAKELGSTYKTVWRFFNDIQQYKYEITEYLKFLSIFKPKSFESYQVINDWEAKIRRSGHLSSLKYIATLKDILGYNPKKKYIEGFRCTPDQFDLKKKDEVLDLYLKQNPKKEKFPEVIRKSIRHFLMVAKGIHIERGFGAQIGLSGEKESYGKYKYVRIQNGQFDKVREYLKNDLETLTFFDWGVESMGREVSVLETKMSLFSENEGIVYSSMYEQKTDKTFQKYLLLNINHAKETWENIKKLGEGREYLFFPPPINRFALIRGLVQIS
jgi:hypothetical protein